MISLSDGTTTVTLPDDLQWTDEFDWQAVEQSYTRGLTGSGIIQAQAKSAGRPITLEPPAENGAWWTRAGVASLQTWLATPDQTMTLSLNGSSYTVKFRHHDAPAVSARPVIFFADAESTHYVLVTLKFITV